MSGAAADVLRLTNVILDGARGALDAPGHAAPLSLAALAGLAALVAWRTRARLAWPAAPARGGATPVAAWTPDASCAGAAKDVGPRGVLDVATPGGGE
jgi:hypothetical protein